MREGSLDGTEGSDPRSDAIRRVVSTGNTVLDLSEDFGQTAVLACRAGASRVYAWRTSAICGIVRDVVRANGCSDRIQVVDDRAVLTRVSDAIEVVVGRIGGGLPLAGLNLLARVGWPRGVTASTVFVPSGERLWMTVVDAPQAYERHVAPWDAGCGIDLAPARRLAVNTWSPCDMLADQFVTEPRLWATIDYGSWQSDRIAGGAEWTANRAAVAHGVAVWPDIDYVENVVSPPIATRPDARRSCAFFPWPEPVVIDTGDEVSIAIRADAIGTANIWSWSAGVRHASGAAAMQFKQSTFMGKPAVTIGRGPR